MNLNPSRLPFPEHHTVRLGQRFVLTCLTAMSLVQLNSSITSALAADESDTPGSHGWLLVANKGEQTLGLVDPVAGRQVAIVPEDGITGHEVAASPDGKRAF